MPDISPPSRQPASRTRVMVFLHSFEPGGVERVALRLCGAWAVDPALDVRLVMGRLDGAMRGEAPPGLHLYVTPEPFPTAAWETIWMMIVLFREIRRQRPDVIFAAGNSYSVVAVVMKLLLGKHCPPFVLKISNDLERRDLPQLVRRAYHRWLRVQGQMIDRFIGLAEPMRDEIVAALGVPLDRVGIIDDPALAEADVTALAATVRQPTPARRYLSVGRLAAQKNYANLLAAFAIAAGPDDSLVIVGEGGERSRLERQIITLCLTGRVHLPGHGAVMPALAAADVFVLSSDYEALPAVVVEALASGLPVVATDCCVSMRGLVGGFGSIVPTREPAALAAAMAAQPALTEPQRADAAAAMRAFTVERAAGLYGQIFMQAKHRSRPENAILAG